MPDATNNVRGASYELQPSISQVEKKTFSRLDLVETVSMVARLLEDTVTLQNRKRDDLLQLKEEYLNKNIGAVSSKGYTSAIITTVSIALQYINKDTAPVVAALAPIVQQTIDGTGSFFNIRNYGLGGEVRRVEAELRGAQVDQELQQLSTDIQKSRETAQGFEGAVRSAATFYGR